MLVAKIHESSRIVVALCDADIVGKKFEQDIRELEVRESFFKHQTLSHNQAVELLKKYAREDATFNIVGHNAVKAAQEADLTNEGEEATIQGVPFVLILV